MSKRDYIIRFLFIIRRLRNNRYATFKEISDCLTFEFGLLDGPRTISLRTFQRDIGEIRTIFNIDIKCNNNNQYYIAEDDTSSFNNRIMEAFDIINSLSFGQKLSPHILYEKRCSSGTEYLHGMLHAIQNRFTIRFAYQKYYEDFETHRDVDPYVLKESKGRWYLLGKNLSDKTLKIFGLDRVKDLEVTQKKFIYPADLEAKKYFENSFGVFVLENAKPEEIVLSFEPLQGKYIKSFPLHDSQKIIQDDETELLIQLKMFVTHDFIMELLSYGENIKVIKPDSLINELKTSYQDALNLY
jgi:predicted DNA-binding transcriptional regulator YafY